MPLYKFDGNQAVVGFKSKRQLRAEVADLCNLVMQLHDDIDAERHEADRLEGVIDLGNQTIRARLAQIDEMHETISSHNATIARMSADAIQIRQDCNAAVDRVGILTNLVDRARKERDRVMDQRDEAVAVANDLEVRIEQMMVGHELGDAKRCKKCNCNAPCRTVLIARGEDQ